MISQRDNYIYEQINMDLNDSIYSNEENQKSILEKFNNNNNTINKKKSNNRISYSFEDRIENLSNEESKLSSILLEQNFFENEFSTPLKEENKFEYNPNVFTDNDSFSDYKNVMVSDLDIKIISSTKKNKVINIIKKEIDLKKKIKKNLNYYF